MKVKKEKLEQLTEDAVRLAGRALSMLFMTRCPYEKEYSAVEHFVEQIDELRNDLELPKLDMELLFNGERPKNKGPIGFQLPEAGDGAVSSVCSK